MTDDHDRAERGDGQQPLDQEQALADLDQCIADREQAVVDLEHDAIERGQADLDADRAAADPADFLLSVSVAHRQAELDRHRVRNDARQELSLIHI